MSSTDIPLVMGPEGPVPTSPAVILETLIAAVAADVPDFTANLPGTLIEDISSTDVAAIAQIDQYRVDSVNDITPYGANADVLNQLGVMFGIEQGKPTNTSVFVIISGNVGYIIQPGFIVSDGTHQYVVQDGGTIGGGGSSESLFAVANQSGSWSVPVGTVTTIITGIPTPYELTCTNAVAGIPGAPAESVQSYRSRILQASIVAGQGTPAYLRTLIEAVPGVVSRLVSILQVSAGWEIIVGGGDSYQVAGAIYKGILDLSSIKSSDTSPRNITVTIIDPPNNYNIIYVNPPNQVVTVDATWNTDLINFTAGLQVDVLAAPAIQNYINGITVGQPINLLSMTAAFQQAVASILPTENLSTLDFTVTINGSPVSPEAGTSIILSDPESYFSCAADAVTVVQG